MVNCSIKNCKNGSIKNGVLRFYSFPKDEEVAKKWLKLCKPDRKVKSARVCSIHFRPSDHELSLRHILMNETPRTTRTLKPDAVPSLFVYSPDVPSSHEPVETAMIPTNPFVDSSKPPILLKQLLEKRTEVRLVEGDIRSQLWNLNAKNDLLIIKQPKDATGKVENKKRVTVKVKQEPAESYPVATKHCYTCTCAMPAQRARKGLANDHQYERTLASAKTEIQKYKQLFQVASKRMILLRREIKRKKFRVAMLKSKIKVLRENKLNTKSKEEGIKIKTENTEGDPEEWNKNKLNTKSKTEEGKKTKNIKTEGDLEERKKKIEVKQDGHLETRKCQIKQENGEVLWEIEIVPSSP